MITQSLLFIACVLTHTCPRTSSRVGLFISVSLSSSTFFGIFAPPSPIPLFFCTLDTHPHSLTHAQHVVQHTIILGYLSLYVHLLQYHSNIYTQLSQTDLAIQRYTTTDFLHSRRVGMRASRHNRVTACPLISHTHCTNDQSR